MNDKQKEILIGTLLGDCSLQTYTNGKSWRARFIQGDVNKDYLFHLYSIFKDFVSTPPKFIIDKAGSKRWYFNTTVLEDLNFFADLFYIKKGNKWSKGIKPEIIELLTPISLSYWYMDDGSLKKVGTNFKTFIFCTDSFKLEELKILRIAFMTNFNIHITFYTNRPKQYRIYIPKKHYKEVKALIEPFVVKSMKYKLG